jgi:hypothetical protein
MIEEWADIWGFVADNLGMELGGAAKQAPAAEEGAAEGAPAADQAPASAAAPQ